MSNKRSVEFSVEEPETDMVEDVSSDVSPEHDLEANDAVSELDELREAYAALEDRYLRQAADLQNFRRRAMDDRALSLDIGRNQVALPMLEVLDDLRRSLDAADQAIEQGEAKALEALHNGVRLVYEKFLSELDRIGIREMNTLGEPFNEDLHEAMLQQPAPDGVEAGTIIGEIQKGYLIGDRVLRHARVVVAS